MFEERWYHAVHLLLGDQREGSGGGPPDGAPLVHGGVGGGRPRPDGGQPAHDRHGLRHGPLRRRPPPPGPRSARRTPPPPRRGAASSPDGPAATERGCRAPA